MSIRNSDNHINPPNQTSEQISNFKIWTLINEKKRIQSIGGISTIVVIFLLVLFTNQSNKLAPESTLVKSDSTRDIASTKMGISESNEFYSQWKKKIASQIAETSDIPSGKISRQPSPLESLVFGDLKGYYLLHMEGVKIKEMRLDQKFKPEEIPRYLGEEFTFLNSHKDLWWVSYNSLSVKERKKQESIVSLLDSSSKIIGEAYFTWDAAGRMTSLKIEKK